MQVDGDLQKIQAYMLDVSGPLIEMLTEILVTPNEIPWISSRMPSGQCHRPDLEDKEKADPESL